MVSKIYSLYLSLLILTLILIMIFYSKISLFYFENKMINTFSNSIIESEKNIQTLLHKNCNPTLLNISRNCLESMKSINRHETLKIYVNQNLSVDYKSRKILKYHHVFWGINKQSQNVMRLLNLNIMSYLATQNLQETILLFWKLENFPKTLEEDIIKKYSFYIENSIIILKKFDFYEFCYNDSILDKNGLCKNKNNYQNQLFNSNLVGFSDVLRFIVLFEYGGIYTDGDTIYLRNFKPLWNFNFVYRWSNHVRFNTAVTGINNINDENLSKLMKTIFSSSSNLNNLINSFHPASMSQKLASLNGNNLFNNTSLKVLHSSLFDAAWLCDEKIEKNFNSSFNCRFDEFMQKKFLNRENFDPKKYFEGAFAYHIHGSMKKRNIVKDSYFYYFEDYFKNLLKL